MIYKIAIGFDPRQCVTYSVCQFSILRRASQPISITPLVIETLPLERQGLTPFTYSRFLVPYLFGFKGWVLFMDLDILCWDDPIEIWDFADPEKAVIVADVEPFERAAVMLFNCAHPDNRILTPEYVETAKDLHTIGWTRNIGHFPDRWNHLVGYAPPNEYPGFIHYTQGSPAFAETSVCEHQEKWVAELRLMNSTRSWAELMGNSIHAVQTPEGPLPKLRTDPCLSLTIPI